jgi:NMD protein affecting ribosome stability and mRNA decay
MTELSNLPSAPGRLCPTCGAALRFSHRAYSGAGRSVDVLRCSGCGLGYRGAERYADEAERRRADDLRARRREREKRSHAAPGGTRPTPQKGRRPLEEGAPENPVIDEETARLLREQLGK